MDEWITRIINAEKTLKELIEMKTITREIRDKCTSFSTNLINWKKEYQRLRINLMK